MRCATNIIQIIIQGRMRLAGHVARVGHNINTYGCLANMLEGKRLFGKLGR